MISKEKAIKSLVEFNKQHNSISFRDYRNTNYKPSYQDIVLIFGSWQEAIQAADIKVKDGRVPTKRIAKPIPFNTMVWLNIDLCTRKCTLHKEGCHLEKSKIYTTFKGLDELYEHGGWLLFDSIEEARGRHTKDFHETEFRLCRMCYRDEVKQAFREMRSKTK